MKNAFALLFILWSATAARAQDSLQFRLRTDVPVVTATGALSDPWSGGLNTPQFSTIDLNKDGQPDLFIFDRMLQKVYTWLAVQENGTWRYTYAPEYEVFFPEDLTSWVLLRDYDCDGLPDIFTSTPLGIRVFRQEDTGNGQLKFTLDEEALLYGDRNINLQMNSADVPAITDMDGDGDLDVLITEFSLGYTLEAYRNVQAEEGLPCGTLKYVQQTNWWGGISECEDCNSFVFNAYCRLAAPQHNGHSGSSLLLLDLDADGDKDLLMGGLMCNDLVRMLNQGTPDSAIMRSFDTNFPEAKPASFNIFPAAYYEDVTFDGTPDLLVAPQSTYELNNINLAQSVWLYRNEGAADNPELDFVQDDFLQHQMIDLSEGAFPAFADLDGDGDQDMLVGNDASMQHGSYNASISYYQNTGTATTPAYTQVTDDYLNLSSTLLRSINPAFADMNGDGATDLILTYQQPEAGKTSIQYIPNTAAQGAPMQFSFASIKLVMAVEPGDAPAFFDADEDGDLDMVLGKASGILPFYRNTGSAGQPAYTLEENSVGNIGLNALLRNLRPAVADLDGDGQPDLLTADDSGTLSIYRNFTQNLNDETSLTAETRLLENSLTGQLYETRLGKDLSIAVAPLGGANKLYVAIGTQGGGLYLLEQTAGSGTTTENPHETLTLQVYPNPADKATYEAAYAQASLPVSLEMYDGIGRLVYQTLGRYSRIHSIPLQHLKAGLYVVRATAPLGKHATAKLLVR
ncbi:T9SS type A sorting domain-containing protein [Pontibacter sp. 172403-2]|uniref:T9SS type A sorting domain-containing protein n=1 Tax=Pontibacter rufus TaxID=2791028 RepID=UPI0018AFFE80|nr:T9SS type A sorting domain-containing protein [Pontibacter sp. 172403-2]MBF9251714.1 T9SS type A sorting domain-containing protein [Pontibacter sp. 172403-2]